MKNNKLEALAEIYSLVFNIGYHSREIDEHIERLRGIILVRLKEYMSDYEDLQNAGNLTIDYIPAIIGKDDILTVLKGEK